MNRQARPLVNYPLAAGSAVLLVLSFPSWNYYWLAPFALTPLLIALARETRPLHRFLLGYVTGNHLLVRSLLLDPVRAGSSRRHGAVGRMGHVLCSSR